MNVLLFFPAAFVRAPILLTAYALLWVGKKLESVGSRVPGMRI